MASFLQYDKERHARALVELIAVALEPLAKRMLRQFVGRPLRFPWLKKGSAFAAQSGPLGIVRQLRHAQAHPCSFERRKITAEEGRLEHLATGSASQPARRRPARRSKHVTDAFEGGEGADRPERRDRRLGREEASRQVGQAFDREGAQAVQQLLHFDRAAVEKELAGDLRSLA